MCKLRWPHNQPALVPNLKGLQRARINCIGFHLIDTLFTAVNFALMMSRSFTYRSDSSFRPNHRGGDFPIFQKRLNMQSSTSLPLKCTFTDMKIRFEGPLEIILSVGPFKKKKKKKKAKKTLFLNTSELSPQGDFDSKGSSAEPPLWEKDVGLFVLFCFYTGKKSAMKCPFSSKSKGEPGLLSFIDRMWQKGWWSLAFKTHSLPFQYRYIQWLIHNSHNSFIRSNYCKVRGFRAEANGAIDLS